jgi:DNA-binding transcriptional regulator YdaS (Cro superfamily)
MTALQKAIEAAGGQTALAKSIGVVQQLVWNWLNRSEGRVPAEHCIAIERATGGAVRCEDLRPDIEWGVLRGTLPQGRPTTDVAAPAPAEQQEAA